MPIFFHIYKGNYFKTIYTKHARQSLVEFSRLKPTTVNLHSIVKYYKDCYSHDVKSVRIHNIFSNQVQFKLDLTSFAPYRSRHFHYPIDSQVGQKIDEDLVIHSQEKKFVACSFFLPGRMDVIGKSTNVFCPLYIHDVELRIENEIFSVELDLDHPVINPAFVDFVNASGNNPHLSYDALVDKIPVGPFNFDQLIELKKVLHEYIPELNLDRLDERLANNHIKTELFNIYKSKSLDFSNTLIPGAVFGLIKKPKGSRGIINELDKLSQMDLTSSSLHRMFNSRPTKEESTVLDIDVPISISESQKKFFIQRIHIFQLW